MNDVATVDLAILAAVARASLADQDLDEAGVKVQQEANLSFEAYAQALERLREFGWLVVDIRRDGAGRFFAVAIERVTGAGLRKAGLWAEMVVCTQCGTERRTEIAICPSCGATEARRIVELRTGHATTNEPPAVKLGVTLPTPTIEVRIDPSRVTRTRAYELTFFGSVEENFEVVLELADGTRVHWDIDHDLENLLLGLAVALNERLRRA